MEVNDQLGQRGTFCPEFIGAEGGGLAIYNKTCNRRDHVVEALSSDLNRFDWSCRNASTSESLAERIDRPVVICSFPRLKLALHRPGAHAYPVHEYERPYHVARASNKASLGALDLS